MILQWHCHCSFARRGPESTNYRRPILLPDRERPLCSHVRRAHDTRFFVALAVGIDRRAAKPSGLSRVRSSMKARQRLAVRVVIVSAVLALLLGHTVRAAAQCVGCDRMLQVENVNRVVFGNIIAECPGGGGHSVPYGNWGVDSNFGSRYDGFQFPGWKASGGWRQWNSCTTVYPWDPITCVRSSRHNQCRVSRLCDPQEALASSEEVESHLQTHPTRQLDRSVVACQRRRAGARVDSGDC